MKRRRLDHLLYSSLHNRLRRKRGRASDHLCVDCGLPADQWSYDHSDPNELVEIRGRDKRPLRYSLDLGRYEPRCRRDHVLHDRGERGPCGFPECSVGIDPRLDFCFRHTPGARRTSGSALGLPDADGRIYLRKADRDELQSRMTEKPCGRCRKTKPVAGFSTRGKESLTRAQPYKSICLECDREISRERYRRRKLTA